MSNVQGKYWCFTVNNYSDAEYTSLSELVSGGDASYIVIGKESGESGTPHLQGYVEFPRKKRLGGVKRLGGLQRAHLERRRGTAVEAADYCKKDGQFIELGEISTPEQGKRSDLAAIKSMLDDGASMAELAEEHFGDWCRYRKSFSAYRNLQAKKVARDVSVYVFSGPPGVGKTRIIFEHEPDLFICPDESLKWFDGYAGEEAILIDDYRGEGNPSFFLRLLDRYPVQLPIKGGFVPLNACRIYITTNQRPPWEHPNPQAVTRRIKSVTQMSTALDFEDRGAVEEVWNAK